MCVRVHQRRCYIATFLKGRAGKDCECCAIGYDTSWGGVYQAIWVAVFHQVNNITAYKIPHFRPLNVNKEGGGNFPEHDHLMPRCSLVPRPIPSFSMLHAEKREGLGTRLPCYVYEIKFSAQSNAISFLSLFFFRRVHSNVRLVLSLSNLRGTIRSGCHRWRDLFGSVQVYFCLPWERRELVSVATHHLRGTVL